MSSIDSWDLVRYRAYLKIRARMIGMNPKVRVRFDESDIVQETLMKAMKADVSHVGQSDEERIAWLVEIQNNLCKDQFRGLNTMKRDISREQAFQQVLEQSTVHWEANVPDRGDSPLELLMKKERSLDLAAMIQQLPEPQRDVVIARNMLHLTIAQTAIELGKTDGQVAGLYWRALKKLKELFDVHKRESD